MKNLKRVLCLMLALLFCVTVFVGCSKGDKTDGSDTTTTKKNPTQSGDGSGDTEDPRYTDTLERKDFGGKSLKISSRKITDHDFIKDTENEDLVNNAIFQRNEALKTEFNALVTVTTNECNYAGNWVADYNTAVNADVCAFDIMTGHMSTLGQLATAGKNRAYDIASLPGVDLTKGWWSQPAYENTNLLGKFYVGVGDLTNSMYEKMHVMFFNETLANTLIKDENNEPIDLYALADDGLWTFDLFKDYAQLVTVTKDEAYGFLGSTHGTRMFQMSFALEVAEKDQATGQWSYTGAISDRTSDAANEAREFWQSTYVKTSKDGGYGYDFVTIFVKGHTLFYGQEINEAKKVVAGFDELGQKFGILPLPKYDDTQLDYATSMRDSGTGILVPSNIGNPEMTGYCMEAMAMYGYNTIRPAYYETVLKQHYLGTPKLAEMLDDIRATFTINFEQVYVLAFGGAGYNATTDQATSSFYSDYRDNYSKWQEKLNTAYGYIM